MAVSRWEAKASPARMSRPSMVLLFAVVACVLHPRPTEAQDEDACRFLCAPDLALEPTISFENIAGRHRIATLRAGQPTDTARADVEAVFEIILSMGIPTAIPRIGLTLEAIWAPFVGTDTNVFTGRSADDLGVTDVGDNPVELEGELNIALVSFEDTGGWLDAHFDIVDQLSPAETPSARSTYTHKLDLELDFAVAPFLLTGAGGWLEGLEIEGSLDYMVTGIPRAGDRLGDEIYLDDASPWGFSVVLVLPLAG